MSHKRLAIASLLLIAIFLFIVQNDHAITLRWLIFDHEMAAYWWVLVLVGLGFGLGILTAYLYLLRRRKEPQKVPEKPAGEEEDFSEFD